MQFQSPPPSPILAMFDETLLQGAVFLIVFMAVTLVLTGIIRLISGPRTIRRNDRRRTYGRWAGRYAYNDKPSSNRAGGGKITAIERALRRNFTAKSIFNQSERRLFRFLNEEVKAFSTPLFVMGQTSLREIVETDDRFTRGGGFYALSDRRIDFTITDDEGRVLVAIEYNGGGHYRNNALERDEIKRVVFEKANIPLLIVKQGDSPANVRKRLDELLLRSGHFRYPVHCGPEGADASPES